MKLLDSARSLLLVIDLQGKLLDSVYRSAMVKESADRLLRLAELFQVPVLLTEQYPKGLGPTQADLLNRFESLSTKKHRLQKTSFGCCRDDGFMAALPELLPITVPKRQIVVAGIEAHVCVMQTVLPLLESGHQVHVCWDAVSSRGEEYRSHALKRLEQAGASITNHESVGFEWARDKNHQAFKALSTMLKDGQPQ